MGISQFGHELTFPSLICLLSLLAGVNSKRSVIGGSLFCFLGLNMVDIAIVKLSIVFWYSWRILPELLFVTIQGG